MSSVNRHRVWLACTAVAVVWILARVFVFSHASLIEFSDSPSYLDKAGEPLWTRDFFFGSGRFFVVPLFYKLVLAVSGSKLALAAAQFVVSLCAWLVLAVVVGSRMDRGWVAVGSFAAILAFGLSTDVIEWDVTILSESISTSLFVLFVAAWLTLGERMTTARLAGVTMLAALWSMSREANSLVLLLFAPCIVLWGLWYWPARRSEQIRCGVLAVAIVAIFAATFAISASGDRWVFPLLNVIGKRVLPSPERTAFYQAQGMPVNARLMEMSGEFGSGKNWAFYKAPELADFRVWLMKDGKKAYGRDLVSHPVRSLLEPFPDVNEFVCPILSWYWSPGFMPLYPYVYRTHFCKPLLATMIVVSSFVVGVLLTIAAFVLRHDLDTSAGFRLLTVSTMLAGWLPFTWFTWHVIGQMEIGRHVWSGVLAFRMGGLLLLLFLFQAATNRFARSRT
jgi:hypothetical protein